MRKNVSILANDGKNLLSSVIAFHFYSSCLLGAVDFFRVDFFHLLIACRRNCFSPVPLAAVGRIMCELLFRNWTHRQPCDNRYTTIIPLYSKQQAFFKRTLQLLGGLSLNCLFFQPFSLVPRRFYSQRCAWILKVTSSVIFTFQPSTVRFSHML